MLLLGKLLDSIDETDLQSLIENQVAEAKTIEYKSELPGNSDSNKKEFLADVSSFANASGGHLILGIEESSGTAIQIIGVEVSNLDAEKLRLENIIRDGLAPRISGLKIHNVKLINNKEVIILEIPKSWSMPHMVTYRDHSRFYSRNSAGKYHLDVTELRSAFALSESIGKQIQDFRLERLGKIVSGETPAPVEDIPKTIFHIIPFNAFDTTNNPDITWLTNSDEIKEKLRPLHATSWGPRYNLDGFLMYSSHTFNQKSKSYIQLFRNGIIESFECKLLEPNNGHKFIPHIVFENTYIKSLEDYLQVLQKIGVEPPFIVMLSLIGVLDYKIPNTSRSMITHNTIDRDSLLLPEVLIDEYTCNPAKILKPIFDSLWNAAGFARSMNYDNEGKWKPQR